MTDRLLLLHWNELSIPSNATATELQANPQWAQMTQAALVTFLKVLDVRPDCRISFSKGVFHGQVADRPLQSWLEEWLGKDRFRKLRSRAVQPFSQQIPPLHELECELSCNGNCGEGITRAYVADSWTWGVASEITGAGGHSIRALKTSINTNVSADVDVRNLASEDHFDHWSSCLVVWGQVISTNHVVASLGRYHVIMYPFDHGYPHIHVHAQDEQRINVKYRVDIFEPLTSDRPPGLDFLIEPWIAEHREQLFQSWQRCQAGSFPLKL